MRQTQHLPIAVICGASPTGLAVARDLGRLGIPICIADFEPVRPAFGTRFHSTTLDPVVQADPSRLIADLVNLGMNAEFKPVLIPTSDAMLCLIAENSHELSEYFVISESLKNGVYERFLNKERFANLCEENHIPAPKTSFPLNAEQFVEEAKEFRYPLIAKPVLGHLWRKRLRGRKLLVIKSESKLHGMIQRFGDDLQGLMFQELIPGVESDIWVAGLYTDQHCRLQCSFVGRKLRQYPYQFGSASLVESCHNESVLDLSKKIVEVAHFSGLCGTEFKLDERDGILKAIEVNPRPTLWYGLISAANVPLIEHAYADLLGLPAPQNKQQCEGVRWLFFEKDLVTVSHLLLKGEIGVLSYFRSLWKVKSHAVFVIDDLSPLMWNFRCYLKRILNSIFKKRKRQST